MNLTGRLPGARELIAVLGCSTLALIAACGSDQPAESPTVEPTMTPTPSPTAEPTSTPTPTSTPSPIPTFESESGDSELWESLNPEFPGSREFYILTNVDGGPLLLPYLDASVSQTEYSLFFSWRTGPFLPEEENGDVATYRTLHHTLFRTDGTGYFSAELSPRGPNQAAEVEDDRGLGFVFTRQVISDGTRVYFRRWSSEKWVDVTDLASEETAQYETDGEFETPIESGLFDIASSRILATFGIFDEEQLAALAEEWAEDPMGYSPFYDFKLESDGDQHIVIAHRNEVSFEDTVDGVPSGDRTTHDVVFTIDAETGLIIHALDQEVEESWGSYTYADSFILEYEVDYSSQVINAPAPGDPAIETDEEKIEAARREFG